MRLGVIEIDEFPRSHDDVVMLFGSVYAAVFTAPAHDGGVGGDASFEDLVPADDAFALRVEIFFDALDEVALKLIFGLQAELFHTRLAFRVVFPAFLGAFVTADMDVFAGKEGHDLVEDVFEEFENAVVAGAKNVIEDAKGLLDMIGTARAAKPGIGRQSGGGMTRHFDLGDDGDIPVGGIFHDFFDLVLGVVTAVFGAVIARPGEMADDGSAAPRAHLRQSWIFLYLDAPALVIGQMPVEVVHFMEGDKVDIAFDEVHREEVAADVEMETAVSEPGIVEYADGRDVETVMDLADTRAVGG